MEPTPETETLIIVARDLAGFYEFLKPRQEADGRTRVLLDSRASSEDGPSPLPVPAERRMTTPEAEALFSVLGFMVLHRDGGHWLP